MPDEGTPPPEGGEAKVEGQGQETPPHEGGEGAGEKLLAGKYKTPEELEKAYKSLESKLGSAKPKAEADPLAIEPPKPEDLPDESGIDAVIARAGVDPAAITEAWEKNGKLADEHYQAFRKVNSGYTRKVVDDFIAGQAARAALNRQRGDEAKAKVESVLGGESQHANLREWAKSNIEPERLERWAKELKKDPGFYVDMMAMVEIEHRRAVGAGKAQPLVAGGGTPTPSGGAFKNKDEMRSAMAESRKKHGDWSKDAAFMARLKATPRDIQRGI